MKALIFGSRNLTWRHLDVFYWLASHATLKDEMPLGDFIRLWAHTPASQHNTEWVHLPETEPLVLLNGDGPPGRERGAIGADKLALFACMQRWPETRRKLRWFPPEPKEGETWAQAAHRRDVEMAEARPDRAYCVHSDLDRSKGSIITAKALKERGLGYWYCRISQSGELLGVERR